jgi:transposase
VRWLSPDEASHRRGRELATVVSDLERGCGVEVLDGRSRRQVERYLRSLPERQREAIEVVSIDPYDAYRQAIHNELTGARIVVDHFHLVRGANTTLDSLRRERQREAGRRRPKGARRSGKGAGWQRDLYRARHRLLNTRVRLTEPERRRLWPSELLAPAERPERRGRPHDSLLAASRSSARRGRPTPPPPCRSAMRRPTAASAGA